MNPVVSVIVPTFRGANRLPTTLTSLARQGIRREDFEVIVVDDGSNEEDFRATEKVITLFQKSLVVSLVRSDINRGPGAARNRGIAVARGEFIFFTDDDCEVPALWIETHVRTYQKHPQASGVAGWYAPYRKEVRTSLYAQAVFMHYLNTLLLEQTIGPSSVEVFHGPVYPSNFSNPAQNTANFSIRRSVLSVVPGFEEQFVAPGGEDTYFAEKIIAAGLMLWYIPYPVRHVGRENLHHIWRMIKNRGLGMYTRFSLARFNWHDPLLWSKLAKRHEYYVRAHATKIPAIASNKRKLMFLGWLYYAAVFSNTALSIHAWRWRRRMRRIQRDEARLRVV
jgi:glycosyltransferase involved in cell wall biosynthesis